MLKWLPCGCFTTFNTAQSCCFGVISNRPIPSFRYNSLFIPRPNKILASHHAPFGVNTSYGTCPYKRCFHRWDRPTSQHCTLVSLPPVSLHWPLTSKENSRAGRSSFALSWLDSTISCVRREWMCQARQVITYRKTIVLPDTLQK